MKSKRFLLPIVMVLLSAILVIYLIMGLNYLDQQSEQKVLIGQIKLLAPAQENSKASAENNSSIEELERQLESAMARAKERKKPLNVELSSTDIFDTIHNFAYQSNLSTYSARALSSFPESVGNDMYTVLGYHVQAEGNPSDIITFIGHLENGEMDAITVENVTLIKSSESWSFGLDLTVHTNPSRQVAANLGKMNK